MLLLGDCVRWAVMEVQVRVWTLRGRDSSSDEGMHGGNFLEKVATVPRQG